MSQKDLQFIERALAHPWMFWVYFWKWPRIVRQACAEYDLLAKERDAAKAAHERSERANKIVRDWIHVTHRLSTTPEAIRAIFAAGKRLSILLVFFVVINIYGQAPPYLRNQWTTNANPLALKVISTNGVHAATNVWELDFTNTATVTVSAVSNANKVMVSFTGSASSGGDTVWTNDANIGAVTIIGDTNRVKHFVNKTIFGSNDLFLTISNGSAMGLGFAQDQGALRTDSSNVRVTGKEGSFAGGDFYFATNCYVEMIESAFGGGWFQESINCYIKGFEGSYTGISAIRSTNCFVDGTSAFVFGSFGGSSIANGCQDSKVTGTPSSLGIGYLENASNVFVRAQSGGLAIANAISVDNADILAGRGLSAVSAFNSKSITASSDVGAGIAIGDFTASSNGTLASVRGIAVGKFSGITNTVSATDGLAFGPVASNERILAQGSSSVAAFALGRDVTSTNNWTFGIHYTNFIPLSLAVGANGTTQFRAASNSVVIRTETAPTVGQILTATDTLGTVGWSNAPSGGSGIATNDGTGWRTTFLGQTNKGNILFDPDNTYDIGTASSTFRPRSIYAGSVIVGQTVASQSQFMFSDAGGTINRGGIYGISDGVFRLLNAGATGFGRLTWGLTDASAPALGTTTGNGHLRVLDGAGSASTNSLIFANTVDTTARTGMTINRQTGRVRLSAGNQTYLVTNNLATANSIVTATVNSDDSTALNVKAIPAAGLITLKANAATTADTDISFFISAP